VQSRGKDDLMALGHRRERRNSCIRRRQENDTDALPSPIFQIKYDHEDQKEYGTSNQHDTARKALQLWTTNVIQIILSAILT
jgi:hypothetical protein